MDYLDKRPKLAEMDMRSGTRKIRCLQRAGSLMAVVNETTAIYVSVQVRES
jgi:hypothetical protein